MSFAQKIYYFFSQYTDSAERRVGKFFANINENNAKNYVSQQLLSLMQVDIVRINLLSEQKYKGYRYLRKSKRKKLYVNAQLIADDFESYCARHKANTEKILSQVKETGVSTAGLIPYPDKLAYVKMIMDYLSPQNGKYSYRESSTFGELLNDPNQKQLLGDCNQIVTLYIYLYSKKFDINDLQLKTYPGHVALHFKGVDVEATNGEFRNYQNENQRILPIREIVSINLLDITDKYYTTNKIDPSLQLQSARLALLVSSDSQTTQKNLDIAYNNAVVNMMNQNDYSSALKYAKQSKDFNLLSTVGHNGSVYFLNSKQYKQAEKFAYYAPKKTDLIKNIRLSEAIDNYNRGSYQTAINQLNNLGGHQDLIKQCYIGLYFNEQKKIGSIKTADDVKQYRSTINSMKHFAKLSGDIKLIENSNQFNKYL